MAPHLHEPPPSLKAVGLKVTAQRQALLRVLDEAERPLTVEEIRSHMVGQRSGIPTIYRNLDHFVREGWAETLVGEDQVMRFVRCRTRHHHHHIQCEACGRTVEVDGCGVEPALRDMEAKSGYRITRHQLALFGRCPDCKRD